MQKPAVKTQVSYCLILKHDYKGKDLTTKSSYATQIRNGTLWTESTTKVNAKTLTVAHQYAKSGGSEFLAIGGKEFAVGKGRVFLVDLTKETPSIEQKKVTLPPQPPVKEFKESDIEAIAESVLTELAKTDESVRAFLEPASP